MSNYHYPSFISRERLPYTACIEDSYQVLLNEYQYLRQTHRTRFSNWDDFRESSLSFATEVSVPFGSALFFWTGLLHGSFVNTSEETRWSFNTRFKNSFSPCGIKDPFQYFETLQVSDLTKLALESFEN